MYHFVLGDFRSDSYVDSSTYKYEGKWNPKFDPILYTSDYCANSKDI